MSNFDKFLFIAIMVGLLLMINGAMIGLLTFVGDLSVYDFMVIVGVNVTIITMMIKVYLDEVQEDE